ncbi:hypothetical protein [Solidesulfovibrio carbinoliphilus]|nr:hypothetical protein [Solidesulfovibrio carbinoliphilus]
MLLSGRTYWFERAGETRFQAGMLVRDLFAKVSLTAFVSTDGSGRLEFVGLSDWGMRLAQASVTLDDPAPARLSPMLARIPKLGFRLSRALGRVFLVWPRPEDVHAPRRTGYFADPKTQEREVHYAFDADTGRLTGKRGRDDRGTWCVVMRYDATSSPQTAPEAIVYQGDGLEILFKLKELSGNE